MKTFRKWLANKLAGLARRIYPQSEEVMSFYTDRMMDAVITGKSVVRVRWPTYFQMRGETPPKPRTFQEIADEVLNRAFEKDKTGEPPSS